MATATTTSSDDPGGFSPLVGEYRRRRPQQIVLYEAVLENHLFPSPGHGPMPMHLMAWPLAGQQRLSRDRAEALVRALYRGIHRRADPDPILGSIVERIPDPVELVS